MEELESKWSHIRLPSGNITASQAERLMVDYLAIREDWANHYANATYYQDKCEWRFDGAYQVAFLKAGAAEEKVTDKTKDMLAKTAPLVVSAKLELMKARAAVIEAKTKLEGSVLAHHAMKKILEMAGQEKYL